MSYRGGGRRGGGGRQGRGSRGGGGQQRWWDPEWRRQELARRGAGEGSPRQDLDAGEMEARIRALQSDPEQAELQIRENYGRDGAEQIHAMSARAGLHSKSYGKGRRTVLVISKAPLPNFRPDLEARREERQVEMDPRLQTLVATAIGGGHPGPPAPAPSEALVPPTSKRPHLSRPREPMQPADSWEDILDAAGDKTGDALPASPGPPPGLQGRSEAQGTGAAGAHRELEEAAAADPAAREMMRFRRKLPAFAKRAEILSSVAGNQVVVVSGETGCGKTTQLPQFILEEEAAAGRGAACNIICTQPRRISAISVAQRVADERGEALGGTVGFQIRLEAKRSAATRLLFCTSGVLLRRLAGDPLLKGVSHIVVDEIHERGMNEDFLLIILRDLLPRRPDLRVVLMSATLNADLFCDYFGSCPKLHIPGFTFPVQDLFLEDVLELTGHTVEAGSGVRSAGRAVGPRHRGGGQGRGGRGHRSGGALPPGDPAGQGTAGWTFHAPDFPESAPAVLGSLAAWEQAHEKKDAKLDLDLVAAVVHYICRNEPEGAILVFMTGWDDISKLHEQLQKAPLTGDSQACRLLPLHGSMPTANQRAIFARPPNGVRKVVLATNIAETSITIDDIVYVVNGCKAKEKSYDPLNNLACLMPSWISKASARQRRGRAGRVQAGKCFHLVPSAMHDRHLDEHQLPELLRTPLEELCLQIKALRLGRIEAFLSKAIQPPDARTLHNAVDLLTTIGALDEQEELTPLGMHLSHLPVDPRVGKMMVMGAMLGCLEPVLIIAAGMAHRDPFVLPLDKKAEADAVKRRFAGGTCSDHVAVLRAYQGWRDALRRGGHAAARDFCWRSFLSANTMQMMQEMVLQFAHLLSDIGFLEKSNDPRGRGGSLENQIADLSRHQEDIELLRAVLCAGMFPSVAAVKRRGKFNAFATREDGKVEPHPSSVNSPMGYYAHRWLVYNDKVKTSGIYLRCSTMVPDYALLLLGGDLKQADGSLTMLDGWMSFSADKRVVDLIMGLRQRLDSLLKAKIESPDLDVMKTGGAIVDAVIQLLASCSPARA